MLFNNVILHPQLTIKQDLEHLVDSFSARDCELKAQQLAHRLCDVTHKGYEATHC